MVTYNPAVNWGEPIRFITKVEKGHDGKVKRFFVEEYGWISRRRAIELVANAKIDNAVLVQPKSGGLYLRALPDGNRNNNFSAMVT